MVANFLQNVKYRMGLISLPFGNDVVEAQAMGMNKFTHYTKIAVIMYELLSSVLKITLAHQHRIHDV